jgi:hypothetical protein
MESFNRNLANTFMVMAVGNVAETGRLPRYLNGLLYRVPSFYTGREPSLETRFGTEVSTLI